MIPIDDPLLNPNQPHLHNTHTRVAMVIMIIIDIFHAKINKQIVKKIKKLVKIRRETKQPIKLHEKFK